MAESMWEEEQADGSKDSEEMDVRLGSVGEGTLGEEGTAEVLKCLLSLI